MYEFLGQSEKNVQQKMTLFRDSRKKKKSPTHNVYEFLVQS